MKTFNDLINEALEQIEEVFPWDLEQKLNEQDKPLLLDIREPDEFNAMHIAGSILAPRGILEQACEWNYDETIPELVKAREREVIVICRSGNRSALGALTMQWLGYKNAISLKTGVRGWNDYDQPLIDKDGKQIDPDIAEEFLEGMPSKEQMAPQ